MKPVEINLTAIVKRLRDTRESLTERRKLAGEIDAEVIAVGRYWLPSADARDLLAISRGLAALIHVGGRPAIVTLEPALTPTSTGANMGSSSKRRAL